MSLFFTYVCPPYYSLAEWTAICLRCGCTCIWYLIRTATEYSRGGSQKCGVSTRICRVVQWTPWSSESCNWLAECGHCRYHWRGLFLYKIVTNVSPGKYLLSSSTEFGGPNFCKPPLPVWFQIERAFEISIVFIISSLRCREMLHWTVHVCSWQHQITWKTQI